MTAERRTADRRVSPAVGELAIQRAPALYAEIDRLREINADLLAALKAIVKAEADWTQEKTGMPQGTFDDPLSDAIKQASVVIAKAEQP